MTIRRIETELIFLLYWLARIVAFPLLILYLLFRGARDRRYFYQIVQRFGFLPESFSGTVPGGIWLHAVSVGEVLSSIQLIHELRERTPGLPVFVSTATLAGRRVADDKLRGIASGVFYAPLDYGFAIDRVLRRIKPSVVVILETEIWPLLFRRVKQAGCGLLVINGRISDRARPRYRRWRWFFRHALACPDEILVQSETDRARYIETGAPAEKVRVAGNLKYDAAPVAGQTPADVESFLAAADPAAVWIAASTVAPEWPGDVDEDDVVIAAFQQVASHTPGLLLILAPRKPERFEVVADKLRWAGVAWVRRSALGTCPLPGVLLLDSLGELSSLFAHADVVFMGGTLAHRGGHNILEPAAAGRATIIGPHMENFAAIADEFQAAAAVRRIGAPDELPAMVAALLSDAAGREWIGSRARELAASKRGASASAAAAILDVRDGAVPHWIGRGAAWPLMWVLAWLWRVGNAIAAQRKLGRQRALDAPVVSIGGISMGGTGKTPLAVFTAATLDAAGMHAAILTRGYHRRSLARSVIVPAGAHAPVEMTGDEAQILIESGAADVGIGSDRYETGRLLTAKYRPDVFVLDDGFQHRQLRRDRDVVLIDALNPFAGDDVFPVGRLREPLTALSRASAFVITRAEPGREYRGIRSVLEHYNPAAPVFRARVVAREWIDVQSGTAAMAPQRGAVAFCGLGNPAAFWRTLATLGIDPCWRWAFDDHHRYKVIELRRLARQARTAGTGVLLTTQKDAVNLLPNAARLVAPARILWLRIETEVLEGDEFAAFLRAVDGRRGSARNHKR